MGSLASAKIVALPMADKHSDSEPAAAGEKPAAVEISAAETAARANAPVAVSGLPVPEPEVVPTASLTQVLRSLMAKITRDRIITAALACISIGALFLFWYLGTRYRLEFYIRFKNVPTPYEVYQQLTQVGLSNKYLVNIAISVRRILLGFFIAMAIGVPLGLAIGKYQRVRDLFMPVIEIMRPIPAIAWVPMSIMLWPNNEASIVFITFIGAFFPILLNTVFGVRNVDPKLFEAAAMLGCQGTNVFRRVVLPAALPSIFTGLRLGHGFAWMVIVVGEMTGVPEGLGAVIMDARTLSRTDLVICGMIVIGIAGFLSDKLITLLSSRMLGWSPQHSR